MKKTPKPAMRKKPAPIRDPAVAEYRPRERFNTFTDDLPPERQWPTASVTETSASFVAWLRDCQTMVDNFFGAGKFTLIVKPIKNYFWIIRQSETERKVFAFIEKSTGNILCPAVFDSPLEYPHGNVADYETRMITMCPWGVRTEWAWLPTCSPVLKPDI